MGEAGKKICLASLQNQSSHVFFGDAEGRTTNPELDLKLGISNTYSAQARDKHIHTFDQVEKNLINGSSATPGATVNFNSNKSYVRQASKPLMDLKLATEMEDIKRLKRIMSNRVSSEKYRIKKLLYTDQLEKLTSALRLQIPKIRRQIEESEIQRQSFLLEQHQLKMQIAAFEKDKILKEDEIGKNFAEVNRLRELQRNQLQAKQHAMHNSDGGLHAINAQLDLNL